MDNGKPESKKTYKPGEKITGTVVELYGSRASNVDGTAHHTNSYHLTKREATIGASGIGAMGSDGDVVAVLALQIGEEEYIILPDSVVEVQKGTVEVEANLRKKALGKLTSAERAALLGE